MTRIIPPAEVVDKWGSDQQDRFRQRGDQPDGVRRIDGSGMSKDEYGRQARQAYQQDRERLVQLQEKRAWLERVMRMRLLGGVTGKIEMVAKIFGKDVTLSDNKIANERLDDLNKKIAALENDIKYNVENLNNTFPNEFISPVLPSPPNEFYVCATAPLMCPCAVPVPSLFKPDPTRTVFMRGIPMGNVNDIKPMVNLTPMGACTSPANPGVNPPVVPTVPCVPVTSAPWTKGKVDVFIQKAPALMSTDGLQCTLGGRILVLPDPSYLENAASIGWKKLRDKATEEMIKMVLKKAGKKIPGVGIVVGMGVEAYDQTLGDWDRATSMEEFNRKSQKRWAEVEGKSGVDFIETLPSYPNRIIHEGGDYWTAVAGDTCGEGCARAVGFVLTIPEGIGDTVELVGDAAVGTSETISAHTLVSTGSPHEQWDDTNVFGSKENENYYLED